MYDTANNENFQIPVYYLKDAKYSINKYIEYKIKIALRIVFTQ